MCMHRHASVQHDPSGLRQSRCLCLTSCSGTITTTTPPSIRYTVKLAPPTSKLLLFLAASIGAYLLLRSLSTTHLSALSSAFPFSRTMAGTSAQGWHERADPVPSPSDFTPTKDALVFAVLLNAQADPEGFTMALFRPDVAVDARGRVLKVKPDDFSALTTLADEATRLPDTGSFMNAWRVAHDRTEQKIDRLFAKTSSGELKETSVQGWHAEKKQLKSAVGDYQELPPVLHELFGHIQEGRNDYTHGRVENPDIIAQIKALVEN